jgi:hypothetical protein
LGAFAHAIIGRGDKEEVGELERKRKGERTHVVKEWKDGGKVKDRVGGCGAVDGLGGRCYKDEGV